MEHLTKHQIVLVTLLVSFVTAITTGIVTVSLVDQSAPSVPQVINHVVERTIEKVIPSQQSAAVITKETIVVRSEDQAIEAINKNSGSVARIYSVPPQTGAAEAFLGLGFFVTKEGLIAADRSIIGQQTNYTARLAGKSYPLELQNTPDASIALFKAVFPKDDQPVKSKPLFAPVVLSQTSLKLGQSVLSLGGETNTNVAMGIISEIVENQSASTTPGKISVEAIKTDIGSRAAFGSPLINLTGEVVGIKTARLNPSSETGSFYLPSAAILNLLPKVN